ncbi:LAGLIDADG family homing endonuclease [Heyndrickxia oleronia]|uniref:LAGLIDADG family homing endonuclease n=1 Tax=Heyndrickxia oleronia TaxID=38875 RepID=UPI00203E8B8A|nr:LAGLIDADG family homing endonuclease [Heyndrickxia oleronia]MCM3238244.1 LAGLIDADG family homing endonuclease [Heyndrickxia oleronia]
MEKWEAAYVAGIIDGEGSITLTRMHEKEYRRPCITIASTDKELLIYIQSLTRGIIINKKNYNPNKYKSSYTLYIKKKLDVFHTLQSITPFLRINQKRERDKWILNNYDTVTPRNGKYSQELLKEKLMFEEKFFKF